MQGDLAQSFVELTGALIRGVKEGMQKKGHRDIKKSSRLGLGYIYILAP